MNLLLTWLLPVILCTIWPGQSTAKVAMLLEDYADPLDYIEGSFDEENVQYAVMFDAGSSGTRIKVYQYVKRDGKLKMDDFKELQVPKPNKVNPGLGSFARNVKSIGQYLKPLLETAKKIVPDNKEATTTLRLFGTAGMRLLKEDERKAIMDEVDALLMNKDINTFSYKKGNSKVISGQDEAIYDWVTVNFLKGSFSGEGDDKTYGTLDMGGASHQNSFELKKLSTKYKPSTVHLNIAGKLYDIFAHSYLGAGEGEARKSFLEKIVKASRPNEKNVVYSRCHNYGLVRNVTVDGKVYEIRGAFTVPRRCALMIKRFFFCKNCEYKNQPKLKGDFYSFSVFTYAFQAAGVVSQDDQVVPLKKIDDGIVSFCNKRVDQLDFDADQYTDRRCFQLNYIRALLRYGFRVGKDFKLHNARKLNGFELNWAVGAMLINNHLV